MTAAKRTAAAFFALLLFLTLLCACGTAAPAVSGDAYIFRNPGSVDPGTPAVPLDPAAVYENVTYLPEMFFGTYFISGGSERLDAYRQEMDYIDAESEQYASLTAIPYGIHASRARGNPLFIRFPVTGQ